MSVVLVSAAIASVLIPRLIAAFRFRQALLGVLLHPAGVVALLLIQWWAILRVLLGGQQSWKGRAVTVRCKSTAPAALGKRSDRPTAG